MLFRNPNPDPPNKQQRQGKTILKKEGTLSRTRLILGDPDGPLGKRGGQGERRAVRRSNGGEEPAHASIMQIICYTEDAITNQKVKYYS